MVSTSTVTIRDVREQDIMALKRLRGTYNLKSAEVLRLGLELLELELNIAIGDWDVRVVKVFELIQYRKRQIVQRYERAHDLEPVATGEPG